MSHLYTAEALSTGAGRDGRVRLADGTLDLEMAVPTAMGGSGEGANPEQLFAAGYAACFHSALQAVARQAQTTLGTTTVGSRVNVDPTDDGGFVLGVELEVVVPDLPHEQAQQLADRAHQVCPYSHATRGNIDVQVRVVQD